jgi:hypothetical protein
MEERLANGVVAEMLGNLAEQLQDGSPVYHDLRSEGVAVPQAVIPEDTAEVIKRMARERGAAEEPDSGPPAPPTPERHLAPVGVEEPAVDLEPVAEEPEQGHGEVVDISGRPSSYGPVRHEHAHRGEPVYNVWLLELKPSMKSKKGRELDPAKFSPAEKEALDIADKEQWLKHLRTGAVEVVPLKQSKEILKNSRELVVPGYARFVRASKSKSNEDLKASLRLVLPGHRIDSSSYRTDSPTVSQVALHLVLFFAASSRWVIGSFDVSSAFLTGKMMARTL